MDDLPQLYFILDSLSYILRKGLECMRVDDAQKPMNIAEMN